MMNNHQYLWLLFMVFIDILFIMHSSYAIIEARKISFGNLVYSFFFTAKLPTYKEYNKIEV